MATALRLSGTDERPLVFVSYSKHDRKKWIDGYLLRHLGALEQEGLITPWTDRDINSAGEWLPRIVMAMRDARVAICMISANFLSTPFCVKEEIPYLLEREHKDGLELVLVLLSPCNFDAHPWLAKRQMLPYKANVEVDYCGRENEVFAAVSRRVTEVLGQRLSSEDDPNVSPRIRQVLEQLKSEQAAQTNQVRHAVETDPALSFEEAETPAWPTLSEDHVDIWRLPETGAELFGRQAELKLLDDAWASSTTNVVSLVGWGGVGKSTLVNKWLEGLKADSWRGAHRVLGWSFHSQGTGERASSADEFIIESLRRLGDSDPTVNRFWPEDERQVERLKREMGKRLADLIRDEKVLLILDGLESLQNRDQRIKDPGLQELIEELAQHNTGLCVITSREEVKELDAFPGSAIARDLEQISPEAGRSLLRVKAVRGTDAQLEQASAVFGNHALAINLLANWLGEIPEHPIARANEIRDLNIPPEKGRHPRRVMVAFAERFGENSAELEVLRLLGLFDRPATKEAIDALRLPPPIRGLTGRLSGHDEASWLPLLEDLRELGLVAPASSHAPDEVDAHPLVREHFGEELRAKHPDAWQAGHARLYEHFKALPEKHQPDTLEEMAPLFQAVFHGCQAGRHQETLNEVYRKRIIRSKREAYLVHQLGAFGADLAALAGFFDPPWESPVRSLSEADKQYVSSVAAYDQRALGRLSEAVTPMNVSLGFAVKQQDWLSAAQGANNLSELQLALGEVAEAIRLAEQSVEYADKEERLREERLEDLTTLANARHQAGQRDPAKALFQEAERLQAELRPEHPRLYSIWGYRYCDLLLDLGSHAEVHDRASCALDFVLRGSGNLLVIALNHLSLGRAELLASQADGSGTLDEAGQQLNQAVDCLRNAGQVDELPRGLLARAAYFRITEQYGSARRDLDEATRIATRSGMRLFECDAHLEYARLKLAKKDREAARTHLARAEELVAVTGYHRRDKDLDELKAALG